MENEITPASEILEGLKEHSNILKSPWADAEVRRKTLKEADFLLEQLFELMPVEE